MELWSIKEEWLVIANYYVAVNITRIMYTPPVTPKEHYWVEGG